VEYYRNMNGDEVKIWKEMVICHLKVLPWNSSAETEENNDET
jgi:hypothetical protein